MENLNQSPLLDNLSAGRDFADYLIVNGWNITDLFINKGYTNQSLTFKKDNVKIDYIITDKESSFKSSITIPQLKGWHSQNYASGPDLEGDISKFTYLCEAFGWVDINTSVLLHKPEQIKKAA